MVAFMLCKPNVNLQPQELQSVVKIFRFFVYILSLLWQDGHVNSDLQVKASIARMPDHLLVKATWSSKTVKLDRTECISFGLKLTHGKLAQRLASAIDAGKIFTNPSIKTDVNGKTYVDARSTVMGRYLNADLKRLGF
jgi:hypothetical protein